MKPSWLIRSRTVKRFREHWYAEQNRQEYWRSFDMLRCIQVCHPHHLFFVAQMKALRQEVLT